jgi:hypothetical protein
VAPPSTRNWSQGRGRAHAGDRRALRLLLLSLPGGGGRRWRIADIAIARSAIHSLKALCASCCYQASLRRCPGRSRRRAASLHGAALGPLLRLRLPEGPGARTAMSLANYSRGPGAGAVTPQGRMRTTAGNLRRSRTCGRTLATRTSQPPTAPPFSIFPPRPPLTRGASAHLTTRTLARTDAAPCAQAANGAGRLGPDGWPRRPGHNRSPTGWPRVPVYPGHRRDVPRSRTGCGRYRRWTTVRSRNGSGLRWADPGEGAHMAVGCDDAPGYDLRSRRAGSGGHPSRTAH